MVLTGGGTGGHITPILAVAAELKKQPPGIRTVYIGERNGKFAELTDTNDVIDEVYTVLAGKFRRYHGRSLWAHITDLKLILLNIRDLFYFLIGAIQAWFLLRKIRPDVVFLKGGFVGVPVGLAAALRKLPFVTHDSDALPGLANRLVSRWARVHAVAMEPQTYAYPQSKTVQVGVLVEPSFTHVTDAAQKAFKQQIGVAEGSKLLLVTGGSSGAQRINDAMVKIAPKLLHDFSDLEIVHQTGKGKAGVYGDFQHPRLHLTEFMRPMHAFTGAADVVVARASANTVAELGVQGKAVIVVASPLLTGGHQIKNAGLLADQGAALSVPETFDGTNEIALDEAVRLLIENDDERMRLARRLTEITRADAAQKLAAIILKQ